MSPTSRRSLRESTSSAQGIIDFVNHRKLPGIPEATISLVDARDVAEALWRSALNARRGELYLAAGRQTPMGGLFRHLERITGVSAPWSKVPIALLFLLAGVQELWARLSGKPVLLSLVTVRLMISERNRSHFDNTKSESELGLIFGPSNKACVTRSTGTTNMAG